MKSKTTVQGYPNKYKNKNLEKIVNQKPMIRTQEKAKKKNANITSFSPTYAEQKNFPNITDKRSFPSNFIPEKEKGKPMTEIINKKMNFDNLIDNKTGKPKTTIKMKQMNYDNLFDKKTGKPTTTIKDNRMNFDNLFDKKAKTKIDNNKMGFDIKIGKNKEHPNTEIISNKINIDNISKITKNESQNKNQIEEEEESNGNNLYINSINNFCLPKGLNDISFNRHKKE